MRHGLQLRPYKLLNSIRNYSWGGRNENAFIPKLLDMEAKPDIPYAELWIGAHPAASSKILIDNTQIPLNELIDIYPREILGDYTAKKFGNKFPFLLKVLSAEQMLSIQTHPGKKQAALLHKKDPSNYPDENHKPEIAVAIDSLQAVAGFKPAKRIITDLNSMPELIEFAGIENAEEMLRSTDQKEWEYTTKLIYSTIMKKSSDGVNLSKCISRLVDRISKTVIRNKEDDLFLEQYKVYGNDVGLLSLFFLNFIELKSGQAIFTDAGVPHAYIKGNIIECMANSDNVIRAGLTDKYKDIDALLEIIKYDFKEYPVIQNDDKRDEMIYKTTAEEFEVSSVKMKDSAHLQCFNNDRPSVYFVTKGSLNINWNTDNRIESLKFEKGESFLIPAFLKEFSVQSDSSVEYFVARIP